jgi:hypothetical protein
LLIVSLMPVPKNENNAAVLLKNGDVSSPRDGETCEDRWGEALASSRMLSSRSADGVNASLDSKTGERIATADLKIGVTTTGAVTTKGFDEDAVGVTAAVSRTEVDGVSVGKREASWLLIGLSDIEVALAETEVALAETEVALAEMEVALTETEVALTETDVALAETEVALTETEVGLIDLDGT